MVRTPGPDAIFDHIPRGKMELIGSLEAVEKAKALLRKPMNGDPS
jgi:hypothetical protein